MADGHNETVRGMPDLLLLLLRDSFNLKAERQSRILELPALVAGRATILLLALARGQAQKNNLGSNQHSSAEGRIIRRIVR